MLVENIFQKRQLIFFDQHLDQSFPGRMETTKNLSSQKSLMHLTGESLKKTNLEQKKIVENI